MLFKTKWLKLIPSNLRPDKKRVAELHKLKVEFGIPHEAFAMRVMSSPAITRKVQRNCLDNLRIQNPRLSERELLKMVFLSKLHCSEIHGYPGTTDQEIHQAMESINSFDELCDCIIASHQQEPSFPDPFGIGERIDEILAQEEVDIKAPAEDLIRCLEERYLDLRKKYPERDEHWFLANTWLERYGSTKEARQKGPELMEFIAYKDTHSFSILEPPISIRGLALFLVYKELGQRQAIYYSSEFSQIMEPIAKSRGGHLFLDKYKERNRRTWKENQVESASPYSLYWFFKGLEFEQEHPEDAEKLWNEIEKKK